MIPLSSNLAPKAGGTFYLLSDIYLQGGFRVLSTTAERDAIDDSCRKQGMLVYTIDSSKYYRLNSDLVSWTEAFNQPGVPGAKGDAGDKGADGATWLFTVSALPLSTEGKDGDFAFSTLNYDISRKQSGTWSVIGNAKGIAGVDGANGRDGIDGAAGINGTNGVDGAAGINGTNGIDGTNGVDGIDGSTWTAGLGQPQSLGELNDFYLDISTASIYQHNGTQWVNQLNIKGIDGTNGTNGVDGKSLENRGNFLAGSTYDSNQFVTAASSADITRTSMWICQTDNYQTSLAPREDTVTNWVEIQTVKGDAGTNGTNGADGTDGVDGYSHVWLYGTDIPSGAAGVIGDMFLQTTNGNVFSKTNETVWSLIGNIKGALGGSWILSATAPTPSDGIVGDAFLNTANGDVYHKDAGGWTAAGNIKGLAGSIWLSGTGAPSVALGVEHDLYLEIVTADLYQKIGGAWTPIANLKGVRGIDGAKGADGTNGIDGAKGDTGTFDQDTVIMPYDIPFVVFGILPAGNSVIGRQPIPRQMSLKADLPNGKLAMCDVAPITPQTFRIVKNGTLDIGSVAFAANSKTGVFTFASDVMLEFGDNVTIVTPANVDATMSDLDVVLIASARAPAVSM